MNIQRFSNKDYNFTLNRFIYVNIHFLYFILKPELKPEPGPGPEPEPEPGPEPERIRVSFYLGFPCYISNSDCSLSVLEKTKESIWQRESVSGPWISSEYNL